jgi:hypothetical protein
MFLLISIIGIPITKGYCDMESCFKTCKMKCCTNEENSCGQKSQLLRLDTELATSDAAVKIPDSIFYTILFNFINNPFTVSNEKHSEFLYYTPLLPKDITVQVRCFRI